MGKLKPSDLSTDLLETLTDFTSKENWDKFFTIRGGDDSFEWYAEWDQLRDSLFFHLHVSSANILVPGCGNSRLSEHLYDAGFKCITNVDFSKVVISDMLRRNIRTRPDMRWRVMDITDMQFADESFDVVVDKGALDALMEPDVGAKLGNLYLTQVRRVLKSGGKYICLTLAESHVLGLLFSGFRLGWKMSVHAVPKKLSSKDELQTYMIVAAKRNSTVLHEIIPEFKLSPVNFNENQAFGLHEAVENENQIRREYNMGSDILSCLKDLHLGGDKSDLMKLNEGRRIKFILGSQNSCFSYRTVLFDAQNKSEQFLYHCGVFLVPKARVHEWLFSSEGQWMVVESSKAARLIMILLESSHTSVSMEDIQEDLSPLIKPLAPENVDKQDRIPFMMAGDGINKKRLIHQVTSPLTGKILVEDVVYESVDGGASHWSSSQCLTYRRLVFQRAEGLIQSEALLLKNKPHTNIDQAKKRKNKSCSKSKGYQNKKHDSPSQLQVCHGYLASAYHTGIVAGFSLISSYLENAASAGEMVRAAIVGLGAGLLPMFLHDCMSFIDMKVVELDPLMLTLAEEYFGFTPSERLKVEVADGIKFVMDIRDFSDDKKSTRGPLSESQDAFANSQNLVDDRSSDKFDVLIIDVDSSDSSSGMTCPAADFVEDSFLSSVKQALPAHGMFIVNLVSRSPSIKEMVVSRIQKVFNHLCFLQLEEDVNLVIFALCSEWRGSEDSRSESALQLEKLLNCQEPEMKHSIIDRAKKITCWK